MALPPFRDFFTSNHSVRDFLTKWYPTQAPIWCQVLDQVNTKDYLTQALFHLQLLRTYSKRPKYANGMWEAVFHRYHDKIPNILDVIGPKPKPVVGVCPQWSLMEKVLYTSSIFYQKHPSFSRFLMVSTNPGAGKTGFDWSVSFLYQDGMPQWSNPDGSPVIVVMSQGNEILKGDYLAFLKKRYPFIHPECFQLITCKDVRSRNRGPWMESKIEHIRNQGYGQGVYVLGLTPQCLRTEMQAYVEGSKTTLIPWLKSIRLFILDECDAIGTQSTAKNLGDALGSTRKIMRLWRRTRVTQSQAIAYLMAQMKENFIEKSWLYLIVAQSATLSQSELKNMMNNYAALAGIPRDLSKEFKKACLITFVTQVKPSLVKVKVERCQQSPLTLEVHNYILKTLLDLEDQHRHQIKERNRWRTQLVQHCLSASFGPEVMLDDRSCFLQLLKSISKTSDNWEAKLRTEAQAQWSPLVLKTIQAALTFLLEHSNNRIVVFYPRVELADALRKCFVEAVQTMNPQEEVIPISEIGILSGSKKYPGATWNSEQSRQRFEDLSRTSLADRFVLMSCACGRGQNLGVACKVLFCGSPKDAKSLTQNLGRIFRAGSEAEKEIHLIIPEKQFSGSERSLILMLRNMYCQGDPGKEMWLPLSRLADALAKEIDPEMDIQKDYAENKKSAQSLFLEIRKDWTTGQILDPLREHAEEEETDEEEEETVEVQEEEVEEEEEEIVEREEKKKVPRQRKRIILDEEDEKEKITIRKSSKRKRKQIKITTNRKKKKKPKTSKLKSPINKKPKFVDIESEDRETKQNDDESSDSENDREESISDKEFIHNADSEEESAQSSEEDVYSIFPREE